MTNPDYTALLFIIDRSGSMGMIKDDMEGGINAVLEEQKNIPGEVTVDVAYFDDEIIYEERFLSLESASIKIQPRGMTALHDAIVSSTRKFGEALSQLAEEDRPGNVMAIIVTDGHENVSKEASIKDVKDIITLQQDTYNWEFLFLGANQDAIQKGADFGLRMGSSMTYTANAAGTMDASNFISASVTRSRTRV
jgi:hypothetical protein